MRISPRPLPSSLRPSALIIAMLALGANGNPETSIPIGEISGILESTTALEASSDSDAMNVLRIQEEWSYAGATYSNYLACANSSRTKQTRDWLTTVVGDSRDVEPFYSDVTVDRACFVVHVDSSAERTAMTSNAMLKDIEPLPVASTIDSGLVDYDLSSLNMTLNAKRFREAQSLDVSVFPKRLATPSYASSLVQGLEHFMNNHSTMLLDNCQITADAPLCCKHFMKYGNSLNHTIFEATDCGFANLTTEMGISGTIHIDIKDIDQEYNACGLTLLLFLAVHPEITYIAPGDPVNVTSNAAASWVIQSGVTNSVPLYDLGVTGGSQVIGISDTGVDEESCFFSDPSGTEVANSQVGGTYTADQSKRKVVMYIAFQDGDDCLSGHGSHCAGSIVGQSTGAGSPIGVGVAKDAKLAVMDISSGCGGLNLPNDMINGFLKPLHDTGGARIHSASWGSASSRYTGTSFQFDKFIYDNPEHLVLIAAGNSGANGLSSVGSPATFKNGLAVGASCSPNTDEDASVFFSSLGPTSDGRIKPEVMSPGVAIQSAAGGTEGTQTCQTTFKSGTSMATPVLAGGAALVRQFLMEGRLTGYQAHTPSAALLKALLISSTTDVTRRFSTNSCQGGSTPITGGSNSAPNDQQGFGKPLLSNVLPLNDNPGFTTNIYDDVSISSGETHTYTLSVTAGQQLRATLVWTDPPPSSAAARILIHDLDLLVEGPSTTHHPNGRSSPDNLNNVERVSIPGSQVNAGETWTVTVTANPLVASDTQNYALVINGGFTADRGTLGGGGGPGPGLGGVESGEVGEREVAIMVVVIAAVVFGILFVIVGGYSAWRYLNRKNEAMANVTKMTDLSRPNANPQPVV